MDQNRIRSNTGKKIKLFTAVNGAYLNYALALENSVAANWDMPLTVFTINCDGPRENYVRFDHAMQDTTVGKFSYEAAYCMRFRALVFPSLLLDDECMAVWIDADSIVRKPKTSFIEHVNACDVTAKQKGENDYASGVLGIGTNAVRFAVTYKRMVIEDGHWKSDQRNFARALEQHRAGINFAPLPEMFCDTMFTDDGVIWTAKIKRHQDARWLKEYEYYLSR